MLDCVPEVLLTDWETVLDDDLLHKLCPGFIEESGEKLLQLRVPRGCLIQTFPASGLEDMPVGGDQPLKWMSDLEDLDVRMIRAQPSSFVIVTVVTVEGLAVRNVVLTEENVPGRGAGLENVADEMVSLVQSEVGSSAGVGGLA